MKPSSVSLLPSHLSYSRSTNPMKSTFQPESHLATFLRLHCQPPVQSAIIPHLNPASAFNWLPCFCPHLFQQLERPSKDINHITLLLCLMAFQCPQWTSEFNMIGIFPSQSILSLTPSVLCHDRADSLRMGHACFYPMALPCSSFNLPPGFYMVCSQKLELLPCWPSLFSIAWVFFFSIGLTTSYSYMLLICLSMVPIPMWVPHTQGWYALFPVPPSHLEQNWAQWLWSRCSFTVG